ncbi:hypothetical protein DZG00_08060 [Clavibacter lycopersici]|uniref:Uncharacterized protein n=1 Tax=Clavibacter lycopersici TaxID=2301718 RepID=A0A399T7D3_9MICO|nr:hypothetical protein [Clavibacter lycopersici]RIJ51648.1 hypothetical protein DZG00_08060 [Clavibacter lycopersici]RIJ61835.1 hypothetical protein DZG02_04880 [Clavibacter lycopersici]
MPSLPLDPLHDRAPLDPASAPSAEAQGTTPDHGAHGADTAVGARAPEGVPADPEAERARWRDRRTGVIALVVVTIALWAVIAAAVGFATTM